jgi:voltage-gated potassium channel
MTPVRRFIIAVFLIILLILSGTVGYHLIEGWSPEESLYMTLITVSTVGFGEVHPLSPAGRYFTIGFIITGILVLGYTATTLITFIFEGQILHTVKERRMKRLLSLMKDHHIIIGFGDVGRETMDELQRKKARFVVVDVNITEVDRNRHPDVVFIQGDATEEEVLEEARIHTARGLISCLPDDQQNVFVVLTARQLNPKLHIVSQAAEDRAVKKILKAGADRVISAKQIAGRRLAAVSIQPSIAGFLEGIQSGKMGGVGIESVKLGKGSHLIGVSLRESKIGQNTGAVIIGVIDPEGRTKMNDSTQASLASAVLQEGDELIALGSAEQIGALEKFVVRPFKKEG